MHHEESNERAHPQVDIMANAASSKVITVAVLLDEGATIIDFAGPWDAFKAATDENVEFRIFAVAPTRQPIRMMGGMILLPDFTFADAPSPNVIVIPAQGNG